MTLRLLVDLGEPLEQTELGKSALARVYPDNPSHPEQAYRATHTQLALVSDDEDGEP